MSEHSLKTAEKTRFCPSPTGYLHLGNVRTALFSALLAKHNHGEFLLRIEDTDRERSDVVYTQALMRDLRWLGLDWEEGVDAGGDAGPYYQSERQAIYDQYYDQLIAMKMAYPCFCTEQQLTLQRKLQRQMGKPPRYAGTCRHLTAEEVQYKCAAGLKPVLRFRLPDNEIISFIDLVRKEQRFDSNDMGDFIIRRGDGTAPFLFCNAIDDALMGVTQVLRGEDHVANTPRQIAILQALKLRVPRYGHIALIVGSDGSPLSKRHGSRSIHALHEEGFLPLAIVNYLARLGHYYGHDRYLTLDALAIEFKIEALAKSPAKYNEQQLLYWQTQAVLNLSESQFWHWVGDEVQTLVPLQKRTSFIDVIKPNARFPKEVKSWAEALFHELPDWNDMQLQILRSAGDEYFSAAISALHTHGADASKITSHLKDHLGLKGKSLFLPIRIALTGHEHGPDLSNVLSLMQPEEIKHRLEKGAVC